MKWLWPCCLAALVLLAIFLGHRKDICDEKLAKESEYRQNLERIFKVEGEP